MLRPVHRLTVHIGRAPAAVTVAVPLFVAGSTLAPMSMAVAHAAPAKKAPAAGSMGWAATQAHATGIPVVADGLTTTTSQTLANPDGTTTVVISAQPVRVKHGTKWVGLDPTLKRNADGSYQPTASTTKLTLSGGGSGPMATMNWTYVRSDGACGYGTLIVGTALGTATMEAGADMNGDGLCDLIEVDSAGTARVYTNAGSTTLPAFNPKP